MRTRLQKRWIAACYILVLLMLCSAGAQAGISSIASREISLSHGKIIVPEQNCYDGNGNEGQEYSQDVEIHLCPVPGFEVKTFQIEYQSYSTWYDSSMGGFKASVPLSKYKADRMTATFVTKPITETQILVDILNEYQTGAASLESGTALLSKSVRLSGEQRGNELRFAQNEEGVPIKLKFATEESSIYGFKIEVNGGDVTSDIPYQNAGFTASQITVNSGSFTLKGGRAHLEKLTMTGGTLNVEGSKSGPFVRELAISGDASIHGDYEYIPGSYNSFGSLASTIEITAGVVSLQKVYLDGYSTISVDGGANVTMVNAGSGVDGRGSEPTAEDAIRLKNGVLTLRDCHLNASPRPFKSIVRVDAGATLNVKGGEYSTSRSDGYVFRLQGGTAHIEEGMIGSNQGDAVMVASGDLEISGGNFYRPVVMNGGGLKVSGGWFMSTKNGINVAANCDIALSGGYYPDNAIFIKGSIKEAASLLAPGYAFYTRKQEIRPDFRLSGTKFLSKAVEGGTMLRFGQIKPTSATSSTNDCIEAAKTASVGKAGTDVQITDLAGGDKEYQIKSEKGLAWVAASFNDSYDQLSNGTQYYADYRDKEHYVYILTADLDMADYDWLPFSFFGKLFDGQGYHIRNLRVTQSSAAFLASLEEGSTLANLVVENGTVKRIENEYGDREIDAVAAGLVGHNYGTIVNCGFQKGTVSAETIGGGCDVGGLVGSNQGSVENSYMTGKVSCQISKPETEWYPFWSQYSVGGIVGANNGKMENSYHAAGDVACDNKSGKDKSLVSVSSGNIVGYTSEYVSPAPTQTNCYDSPSSATDLNKNKDTHNTQLPTTGIAWKSWLVSTMNAGFPVHYAINPSLPYIILKADDGTFIATYEIKKGELKPEKKTIEKVDEPYPLLPGVELSLIATPKAAEEDEVLTFEKFTLQIGSREEEAWPEDLKVTIDETTGVATSTYTMGAEPAIIKAYFKLKKIVIGENETESKLGEQGKETFIGELDIPESNSPKTTVISFVGVNVTSPVSVGKNRIVAFNLSGNNVLNGFDNKGTMTLSMTEGSTLDIPEGAVFKNEGTFTDQTGLITEVEGTAALTVIPREQTTLDPKGGTISADIGLIDVDESELSYFWQRLENGNWTPEMSEPKATLTKSTSILRAEWANTAKSIMINPGEEGKYRCWITREEEGVVTTLVTSTVVEFRSSGPDITYYSVALPSIEGATLSPSAGTYSVEAGGSFSFSLTLNADYDQSTPIVKVGDKVIEPASDGKYEIKGIASDITISITGIVKNTTVGNAEVESNALKICGSNGVLHIQSAHVSTAYIMTFGGQLYKALTLPIGETMITIPQGAYVIRVENQSYKIRF